MKQDESFKKQFQMNQIIWFMFFISIFIYGLVAFLIISQGGENRVRNDVGSLRIILFLISIADLFLADKIKTIMAKKSNDKLKAADPGKNLLAVSTIVYSFCEAPAIFGLILSFLSENINNYFLFAALSLVGFVLNFPKDNDCQDWLNKRRD